MSRFAVLSKKRNIMASLLVLQEVPRHEFIDIINLKQQTMRENEGQSSDQKLIMMCDPVTGICEIPETSPADPKSEIYSEKKPVKLVYFTDPICSSCWGIEPQLRRLKLEYGAVIEFDYRMGGLLESWETYGGRDVSGPQSVAQHWEEASAHYHMPIDGEVWLEDPMDSSYPASIAFKAAQLQGEEKSMAFLRRIREMVFLEKKNISRWEHLERAARDGGLDVEAFKSDYENRGRALFEDDLAFARAMGVRGFPTIFFTDQEGNRLRIYGSKPYANYESALLGIFPDAKRKVINTEYESLFSHYPTMTVREFAELTGSDTEAARALLNTLADEGKIRRLTFKNGKLLLFRRK